MTDRHLFTAAGGKHAEGTRKNCAVAMPAGRKTKHTVAKLPKLKFIMKYYKPSYRIGYSISKHKQFEMCQVVSFIKILIFLAKYTSFASSQISLTHYPHEVHQKSFQQICGQISVQIEISGKPTDQKRLCVCSNANPLQYYALRVPHKADRWHIVWSIFESRTAWEDHVTCGKSIRIVYCRKLRLG